MNYERLYRDVMNYGEKIKWSEPQLREFENLRNAVPSTPYILAQMLLDEARFNKSQDIEILELENCKLQRTNLILEEKICSLEKIIDSINGNVRQKALAVNGKLAYKADVTEKVYQLLREGKNISQISNELRIARNTVRARKRDYDNMEEKIKEQIKERNLQIETQNQERLQREEQEQQRRDEEKMRERQKINEILERNYRLKYEDTDDKEECHGKYYLNL